ncbi:hypothetical protein ACLOJK_037467 [Asimina triloba]
MVKEGRKMNQVYKLLSICSDSSGCRKLGRRLPKFEDDEWMQQAVDGFRFLGLEWVSAVKILLPVAVISCCCHDLGLLMMTKAAGSTISLLSSLSLEKTCLICRILMAVGHPWPPAMVDAEDDRGAAIRCPPRRLKRRRRGYCQH